LLKHINNL